MLFRLRAARLLSAGLLTFAALAAVAPGAQAANDCGASVLGPSAAVGGSCVLAGEDPVTLCAGVLTTDGYTWEFDVDGWGTIPGCEAGSVGAVGCQAWTDESTGPYLNAGVDCAVEGGEWPADRACLEANDSNWLFLFYAVHRTTLDCGRADSTA